MGNRTDQRIPARFRNPWFAARWICVVFLLLALNIMGASAAQAHTLPHPAMQALPVAHGSAGADCCAGHESEPCAAACAMAGACVVCAIPEPGPAAFPPFSTRHVILYSSELPAGRSSSPYRRPPRDFLPV